MEQMTLTRLKHIFKLRSLSVVSNYSNYLEFILFKVDVTRGMAEEENIYVII